MTTNLINNLWLVPCAQAFIKTCTDDLASGMSICVVLPNYLDADEFVQILLQQKPLQDRRLGQVTPLLEEADRFDVENYICEALGYHTFESFLQDPYRYSLVYLDGFGAQPIKTRQGWFDFLRRWGNAFHGKKVCSSLLLVVTADSLANLSLPSQDTHLRYQVWRAIPSSVEVRLLCRLEGGKNGPEDQWREAILPSLVGHDLILLDWLWEYTLKPIDQFKDRITKYKPAHWNGNSKFVWKDLERYWSEFQPLDPVNLQTSGSSFELWGSGFIHETPEYGREIHTTLLMQCTQETKALYRLWRGQVTLMLPMIEEICLGLDDLFTRSYHSRDWVCYVDPIDLEAKPPLEMRDYQKTLELRRYEPRCKGWHQHWYEDVKRTRELRNNLAHGTVVAYEKYKDLYYFLGKVRDVL